jgi:hypothetical protein
LHAGDGFCNGFGLRFVDFAYYGSRQCDDAFIAILLHANVSQSGLVLAKSGERYRIDAAKFFANADLTAC